MKNTIFSIKKKIIEELSFLRKENSKINEFANSDIDFNKYSDLLKAIVISEHKNDTDYQIKLLSSFIAKVTKDYNL